MCSVRDAADRAHAEYTAARATLLRCIAELAESGAWRGDGAGNLTTWLSARWQIGSVTARELVREAEALAARPALQDALSSGAISVDQCRALEVLGRDEPEHDGAWLECLPFRSIHDLQREARKQVARDLERRDGGVYLRMAHTPDEAYLRGQFQLHPEDGAALISALDARIPDGTKLRDYDHAYARALVELATGEKRTATVLLSVDADTGASLQTGGFVGAETAQRLSCDASVQNIHKDGAGRIVGIGRRSRTVPGWLRRVVLERDGCMCTFPGCGRDRHLECHHRIPWAEGGRTDLPNLLTTCWTHHELLHEGRWSLTGESGPHITWVRPDGSAFEPRVRVTLDTS